MGDYLHSDKMPVISPAPPVTDLFANLNQNWNVLMPATVTLFGIMFGSFVLMKIFKHVKGDSD